MTFRVMLVTFLLVLFQPADAGECNYSCKSIPSSDNVLFHFGSSTKNDVLTNPVLELLVWNVHKGADRGLVSDLMAFQKSADLFVFQEIKNSILFLAFSHWSWWMGTSFFMDDEYRTGVATSGDVQPISSEFRKTADVEPFVKSPKIQLLSQYYWQSKDLPTLMVINIHGINWSGDEALTRQLGQVSQAIQNHTGPLVYAGDFNTKNTDRMKILKQFSKKHSLTNIVLNDDHRVVKLDHVLVRGVTVSNAELLDDLKSSDHPAIRLRIERN